MGGQGRSSAILCASFPGLVVRDLILSGHYTRKKGDLEKQEENASIFLFYFVGLLWGASG
jgi:hypothetical protein